MAIYDSKAGVSPIDGPLGDAATFNGTFDWEKSPGLQDHIQDLVGTTIRDNPVLPHGDNVLGTVRWQLDAGLTLNVGSDGIITYGFFDRKHAVGLNNNPSFGEGKGYAPFTAAQKAAARIAIKNWDDLIAPDFVEATGKPGAKAGRRTRPTSGLRTPPPGPAQAWAYYPGYGQPYAARRRRRVDRRSAVQHQQHISSIRAVRPADAEPRARAIRSASATPATTTSATTMTATACRTRSPTKATPSISRTAINTRSCPISTCSKRATTRSTGT